MALPAQNNTSSNEWICTQTRGDRLEFEWKIKKFHLLPQKNEEDIYSPAFPDNSKEQWKLRIYPHGARKEDAGWISAYLQPVSDEMRGIKVKYEIIIFQLNQRLKTREFTYQFSDINGYGNTKFLERSKLSVKDDPTDTITICCKIEVLGTYTSSSSGQKIMNMASTFEVRKNGLSRDLKSLYENLTLTDFTIISGDTVFPTHKLILTSRSPVFAAMFQHREVSENVKNQVKIENIEPAIVRGLLEFIYTDDVSEIEELAHGLLVAAEQYGLGDLKEFYERTLCKSLNENNAVELVALADLHNANNLKKCVMQYIVDHPDIVQLKSFESVELLLQLSREIIRALALKAEVKCCLNENGTNETAGCFQRRQSHKEEEEEEGMNECTINNPDGKLELKKIVKQKLQALSIQFFGIRV